MSYFQNLLKNRRALSGVITTLIILVASIVLGVGVVLYSTNLFQSGSQQASLNTSFNHLWAASSGNGTAWGAGFVKNTGDKDLIFIEIQIGEYFGEDDIVRLDDNYGRI